LGILRFADWKLDKVEVLTEMKQYHYEKGKYYRELKIAEIDFSRIANFEWIEKIEEWEEKPSEAEKIAEEAKQP
jgi:hypothetical protein